MKKIIFVFCFIAMLSLTPFNARADLFGGDVVVLTEILANAMQQLIQLKQMLSDGQDSLNLMRDINRGVNDSLNLMRTVYPDADPGIYKQWDKVQQAISGIQSIYGSAVPSSEAPIQRDTDQSVSEAIALNNSIYKYSQDIDDIGEVIKTSSHSVSPGGAQKLTAQTLGVMLNVMSQSLRAQATGLKIQSQTLELQNHKDKELTRATLENASILSASMKSQDVSFETPRF